MALMSEERRKEMEEEMSRFELEIAVPGETKQTLSSNASIIASKPLSPPPPPPAVTVLLPEVLAKAPPPPPPPLSPPVGTTLQPPPPLPVLPTQPATPSMRFIPHQLQRPPQAPRSQIRPNFMGMRGPPMAGPPGPFPPPGSMGPFGPPMGQGPPMSQMGPMNPGGPMHPGGLMPHGGPMPPGGPMHPMPPGAMSMPPMPHGMGNMGVSLPMPPGFCPPGPPMGSATNMRFESQSTSSNSTQNSEASANSAAKSSDSSTVVASAPTIYAAPFMKSLSDSASEGMSTNNGQDTFTSTVSSPIQKSEKVSTIKVSNEPSAGPAASTNSNNEETVVSKKKEKKKKIIRMAGGQAWEDNSLLDWDNDDFRIFCGDLGNDVTDEVLIRAFSKYSSFVKAKVIRDKRTNKTKGFGFVSFKDPQDFIKAMREMNGKFRNT
ncbi:RNA-binding protein 42 [Trichonephila inaurata madagascariensis]|uniref:RNA-binding protein 42 n=1 Tax=Trichonephila inaurata madagascariensis TaxID=2747483 RepID=A0A8X7CFU3_9ARAC|nr:RNA-binding protein 42 [Trichonephila inaurata madagascariensis]